MHSAGWRKNSKEQTKNSCGVWQLYFCLSQSPTSSCVTSNDTVLNEKAQHANILTMASSACWCLPCSPLRSTCEHWLTLAYRNVIAHIHSELLKPFSLDKMDPQKDWHHRKNVSFHPILLEYIYVRFYNTTEKFKLNFFMMQRYVSLGFVQLFLFW